MRPAVRRATIIAVLVVGAASGYSAHVKNRPLNRAEYINGVPEHASGVELERRGLVRRDRFLGFREEPSGVWYPYLFDIRTVQITRLDQLKAAIRSTRSYKPWWVSWRVSPDGRWLLWGTCHSSVVNEFFVASLDGKRVRQWRNLPRTPGAEIVWQDDSKSWMLLTADRHAGVLKWVRKFSLSDPGKSHLIALTSDKLQPYLAGALPGNRLLTTNLESSVFSEFEPENAGRTKRTFRLKDRSAFDGGQAVLSPAGDRFALLRVKLRDEPSSALGKWFADSFGENTIAGIVIADLAGNVLSDLGNFDVSVHSHSEPFGIYGWSSNLRRLLLLRDGRLQWIPVD